MLLKPHAGDHGPIARRLQGFNRAFDRLAARYATFTGAAVDQVEVVLRRIAEVTERHPAAAAYAPGAIL